MTTSPLSDTINLSVSFFNCWRTFFVDLLAIPWGVGYSTVELAHAKWLITYSPLLLDQSIVRPQCIAGSVSWKSCRKHACSGTVKPILSDHAWAKKKVILE